MLTGLIGGAAGAREGDALWRGATNVGATGGVRGNVSSCAALALANNDWPKAPSWRTCSTDTLPFAEASVGPTRWAPTSSDAAGGGGGGGGKTESPWPEELGPHLKRAPKDGGKITVGALLDAAGRPPCGMRSVANLRVQRWPPDWRPPKGIKFPWHSDRHREASCSVSNLQNAVAVLPLPLATTLMLLTVKPD